MKVSMRNFLFFKLWWLSLLILGTTVGTLKSQDALFTQYFSSPVAVNPAFSGVNDGLRINSQFRMNWINWPTPFKTAQITLESFVPQYNSGLGIKLLTDDAGNGVLKTNQLTGLYAYQLQINKEWFIRFGLEGGVNQVQLNWSKLFFEDQIDPFTGLNPSLSVTEIPPNGLTRLELDLGTGILIFKKNIYAGVSLRHLNRFNQSFWNRSILETGRPMTLSVQSGFDMPVPGRAIGKGDVYLSPMLLYMSNNESKVLQLGSSYHLGQLITGLWARFGGLHPIESMVGIGFKYGIYRIMYTAEIPLDGKGLQRTFGSHELTLSLRFSEAFNYISKKSAQKTLNCFRFNN
ncbi:MAG: hypothetical protein RLZZ417_2463 [Bacteroidota bacterium]|jgi:type IX secretion system PorP/SprF family membrane protein